MKPHLVSEPAATTGPTASDTPNPTVEEAPSATCGGCCTPRASSGATPPAADIPIRGDAGRAPGLAVVAIQKMDCPTEERLIRDKLQSFPGVEELSFNLLRRELTVRHSLPDVAPVLAMLSSIDMDPVLVQDSVSGRKAAGAVDFSIPRRHYVLLAISGVAAVAAEVIAWTTGADQSWPVIALALLAIVTGGLDTLRKGWIALRSLSLNMNFLMSVAVIGAVAIGQWPEAAVVIFLFALAEMIEALSLDRARNAIQGLMAMTPDTATIRGDDGTWKEVPAAQIAIGAIARIRPGERFALDGVVLTGQTTVNQAPITGESMPVTKEAGDQVFAGTINERGSVEYRVTAEQGRSTLAQIIETVQEAQGQRAPTQRFVDRFARYYIPVVFAIAIAVAVVPPLLVGGGWSEWIYKALVLLVIACPCALVISTPVTIVTGLAAAARQGILIKGGLYLEQARGLFVLAVDKTGTLTEGRPRVTDVLPLQGFDEDAAVVVAASLAAHSDHPVSTAIAAFWRGKDGNVLDVVDVESLTGRGMRGSVGGRQYHLGNHRLVEELGACNPQIEALLDGLEREAKSVVVLVGPRGAEVIVAVADVVRATSAEAVKELSNLGVRTIMLTGDNPRTAEAIAKAVGIADVRAGLLPEEKLLAISALTDEHRSVGMVGDGVNDAPALAKSTIGFAMGAAGTDTALEVADVALMDDDLRKIPGLIRLSRRTRAILMQNITLALGTKAIFFVLALAGEATLWMAVFADLGVSLIVVFNGLRLLRVGGPALSPTASNASKTILQ